MSKRIVTPVFRASFVQVFEMAENRMNGKKEVSITMLFPKKGTDFKALRGIVDEAIAEGIVSKWGGKKPANLMLPFHDGAEKADRDGYGPDVIFARAYNRRDLPQVKGPNMETLTSRAEFDSGDYARASISAFPWNQSGKCGVSLSLGNVQKVRDGARFSGARPAEDEFDALPDNSASDPTDMANTAAQAPAANAAQAPAANAAQAPAPATQSASDPFAALGI